METSPRPRPRAWIPALIGLALIVGGFVLAELAVEVLFSTQDPAGKGMAGGLVFFVFLIAGVVFLIAAAVIAIRNRAKPG
jgi:hypothetical protein